MLNKILITTKLLVVTLLISLLSNTPFNGYSTPVTIGEEKNLVYSNNLPEDIKMQPKVESKRLDNRAKILRDYFAKYNSPLQYHAQDFIDAADENEIDWRLVPAIAGVESTFGKFIPTNTYNGWGWGVYGDQALGFKSWRDGIFTVSGGLKKNYIDRGLKDPYAMNRVYAASPTWGVKVSYFLNDIDRFSRNYVLIEEKLVPVIEPRLEITTSEESAELEKDDMHRENVVLEINTSKDLNLFSN